MKILTFAIKNQRCSAAWTFIIFYFLHLTASIILISIHYIIHAMRLALLHTDTINTSVIKPLCGFISLTVFIISYFIQVVNHKYFYVFYTKNKAKPIGSVSNPIYQNVSAPKCSRSIFSPSRIRMIPPASSALDLYLTPNIFPAFTPIADRTNVVIPIAANANIR